MQVQVIIWWTIESTGVVKDEHHCQDGMHDGDVVTHDDGRDAQERKSFTLRKILYYEYVDLQLDYTVQLVT